MKIIAKVPILYNSVTYKPGDELPNNNPEMTKAWKEAGTVKIIYDKEESSGGEDDNFSSGEKEPVITIPKEQVICPDGETPNPDTIKDNIPEFYTEEQLGKLKSKADIIDYAESIGLSGLDANLHRPELIDKVLEYIEEVHNEKRQRDDP